MYIDFGAGEAILSGHEDEVMRDLKKKLLRKEVLAARHGANPLSPRLERLRSRMGSWRLALAERLAAFEPAQSLLNKVS
jgi:uncharacterized protein YbgA (DUF1722 family)